MLSEHTFDGLANLQELFLSTNRISSIEANTFAGLRSLRLLGLDQNSLHRVSGDWFGPNPLPVKQLYLYRSSVHDIDDEAFRSLPDLMMLSLYGNRITALNEHTFEGLANLQELFLWNNCIETIERNTFKGLRSAIMFGLDDNSIETISGDWFGPDPLPVQRLHLNGNSLQEIPNGSFESLPHISTLNLHNNQITRLGKRLFEPCNELRMVTLQNNRLTEISAANMDKLYGSAESFDISGNRMTFLPTTSAPIRNLKQVRMGGNPWQCACVYDIFDLFMKHKVDYGADQLFSGKNPICFHAKQRNCIRDVRIAQRLNITNQYQASIE